MNFTVLNFNSLRRRHLLLIVLLVLIIHLLLMLLFKRHEIKDFDFKSQQKENTIEVKIEPVSKPAKEQEELAKEQEELIDDPIKLIPTNAQQVGLPDAPAFTVPSLNPMPVEQQSIEDAETEPEADLLQDNLIEDNLTEESEKEPELEKISTQIPEKEADLPKEKPEKAKLEKKIVTKTKKVIKSRYGNTGRKTMPGFFEKMKNAADNTGDAMFGDTLFIQGEPGLERDLLQIKLQSYLRKLPWYLTQSFNSQQHQLRSLLKNSKNLQALSFSVTINKNGEVIKLVLITSTGNESVDKLMFDIIRSASPFPFIPVSLRRDRLQLPGTLDPYVMSQGASVIIRN